VGVRKERAESSRGVEAPTFAGIRIEDVLEGKLAFVLP
jgi:hypothetical protein